MLIVYVLTFPTERTIFVKLEAFGVIVYTLVFIYIIYKWDFFEISSLKRKSILLIFFIKIGFGFLLYAIYFFYYGNNRFDSDAFRYFDDSLILYETLKTDFSSFFKIFFNIGNTDELIHITSQMNFWTKAYNHGLINDNQTMIRLNLIFDLFSFGHYHIHTVYMSFISLIGLTSIYKAFENYFLNFKTLLFSATFLIPTVLFWSSGVLKEGLLVFALGVFLLCLLKSSKNLTLRIAFGLLSLFLLLTLKVYVIVALIPGFITYLILTSTSPNNFLIKFMSLQSAFITALFFVPQLFLRYDFLGIIATKQRDFINVASTAGSAFEITKLKPNLFSLLSNAPEALTNALFRPFIWDSNALMMVNSIENMVLFTILIVCLFITKKLSYKEKNTVAMLLSFSLYLLLIIGWTTPVSGAIVRYKLPILPLLLIAFFIFTDKAKIYKKTPLLSKLDNIL